MKSKILEVLNFKKIWIYIIIATIISGIVLSILLISNNKNISKKYNQNSKIENKTNKNEEEENNIDNHEEESEENNIENHKKEEQQIDKSKETSEKESKMEEEGIEKNNNIKNEEKTTTEIIEINETIPFNKSTKNEVNMFRGTTKVIQNGVNGTKAVKYKVTYDSNNIEISREVISETITKEPVNEVTRVGISDYNLNTDTYGIRNGYVCSSDELDELEVCGYSGKMYCAIVLNNTMYLTNVVTGNINCLNGLSNSGRVTENIKMQQGSPAGTVNYNGQNLYYDVRAGADEISLTEEICNKNNLSCGRW